MIAIDFSLEPKNLRRQIDRMWELSAPRIAAIDRTCPAGSPSPVFTVNGAYTARGWTDWTRGFQHGSAILQFDATDDRAFLTMGRDRTVECMAPHITHMGVHDHGFNNVSTCGALRRLMLEGRIPNDPWELRFYELALKCSGAVQARRWTALPDGGYIYSFNGPHSLFADTIRSLRSLALGHMLGHELHAEQDEQISLLQRLVAHARTTATHTVFYGTGRDAYDVRGRVAHESIFNMVSGAYRCPNSQQGYSPFTTWTRGLAWIMLGFAEELEWIATRPDDELAALGGRTKIEAFMRKALEASCDFYVDNTPIDGVPYWDTGAPGLVHMGDYLNRTAEPFNEHEPVDSSAAAIAAQALLRAGRVMGVSAGKGRAYWHAGLTVMRTLLGEPYLNAAAAHQGLLLHSVYHRPNGWDHVPPGRKIPCGESSMWGDYHLREAALYVQRVADGAPYLRFF